jgi:8-oxo-dGTP pyrophosphatase MutT (NUDIX family)
MICERPTFHAAVYLLLRFNSALLLLRRDGTEYKKDFWSFPSGHVEHGESISSAIQREVLEEIAVVLPADLEPQYCLQRVLPDGLCYFDFFFVWEIQEPGLVVNAELSKCSALAWFDDLPPKSIEYLPQVLDHIRAGKIFGTYFELNVS